MKLRQAISYAYNVEDRIRYLNYQAIAANGPVPPGVAGYRKNFSNKFCSYNLQKARKCLQQAGYPDGLDPKTGNALELTFDQTGSSIFHRQFAEMFTSDMAKIGIKIKSQLNNRPRFFQKLRSGQMQIFRLSWVGDYPDAENFLQLFYSKNIGGCNRVGFADEKYDKMYEKAVKMKDTPERTGYYEKMISYLVKNCPWVFETHPVSFRLMHSWLENYYPHDFAFQRLKYLSVSDKQRQKRKKSFEPLRMNELR